MAQVVIIQKDFGNMVDLKDVEEMKDEKEKSWKKKERWKELEETTLNFEKEGEPFDNKNDGALATATSFNDKSHPKWLD